MWFSLFSVVLILAMTFFQGLQGVFSALINCVLTILAAALAFGLYEDLYYGLLIQYQPDHGRGIALVAVFVISLLVLRTIFDMVIKGNMRFPMYVDRAVGGALGLVSALITVGMLAIGVQLLPFGQSFLGFSRYVLVDKEKHTTLEQPDDDKPGAVQDFYAKLDYANIEYRRRALAGFLNPDGFTVALVSRLSSNALAGRNRLSNAYPDFQRAIYTPHSRQALASRTTVAPTALKVEAYWYLTGKTPGDSLYVRMPAVDPKNNAPAPPGAEGKPIKLERYKPENSDTRYLVIRAAIDAEARDEDNIHRFTTEQVRLVAAESATGTTQEFYLTGINHDYQTASKAQRPVPHWIKIERGEAVERTPTGGPLKVDLVFQVPDKPGFKPLFVEYKQNARAALTPNMDKSEKPPAALGPPKPPKQPGEPQEEPQAPEEPTQQEQTPPPENGNSQTPPPNPGETRPQPKLQDRVSTLGPTREAIFSDRMPFTLTSYDGNDIEMKGNTLEGGYVRAVLDNDWEPPKGNKPAIERFQVPEGQVMLQVSVEKLHPESFIGNVLGNTVSTVQDFYLVAEGGKPFRPVGMYAMATSGGEKVFELRYLDSAARDVAHMPKFDKIKADNLRGQYALFFLFHVPPGTKPVEIHTGGRTPSDLRQFNLEAPR